MVSYLVIKQKMDGNNTNSVQKEQKHSNHHQYEKMFCKLKKHFFEKSVLATNGSNGSQEAGVDPGTPELTAASLSRGGERVRARASSGPNGPKDAPMPHIALCGA